MENGKEIADFRFWILDFARRLHFGSETRVRYADGKSESFGEGE